MKQRFRPASLVPAGLMVDGITIEGDRVVVRTRSAVSACPCPDCGAFSQRIQSRYFRRAKDLPLSGRRVELQVLVRRFRCDAVLCGRQIFAERFGDRVLAPRARRTDRLDHIVQHLGLALGGRPGASFAARMMLPVSNDTLLRVVRQRARVPSEPLRVIGIDDFAWRRNHRYGTIVCDLERRRPVALLCDREPATSEAWLRHQRLVHTVARDRGGGYGEAVARALPQAVQVADRWHLMENASRAFLDAVRKSMRQIRSAIGATVVNPALLTAAEKLQYDGYLRREEINAAVLALWREGVPIKQIVKRTGHHRQTVRRIVRGERSDVFRPRQSSLDAHLPWLDAQWDAGARNAAALWRTMRTKGFRGSLRVISEWATRRRRAEKADASSLARVPSARTIARLMTTGRDNLTKAETVTIAAIEDGVPGHIHEATPDGVSWYQTNKGRLVLTTGALLGGAWASSLVWPAAAHWAFIVACVIGIVPVARKAYAAARAGLPFTIEMLMTIAATGALFIGAAEEAALVVFLFAVGEVLESVAADRARASIRALGDLVPKTAIVEENGVTRKIDAAALMIGQTVLVRPGDRIPADGEITDGVSGIDESPVTGESVPKTKGVGEPVFAGSVNSEAALRVRVTKAAEDNTISRIIRLVEEAQEARAPTERFIDRFSRVYMPAIVGLAVLVAIVPPLMLGAEWSVWIYRALALLLIGCPCALVISVPASIAASLSTGARQGLLMKGGVVIEAAAKTGIVTFDKTGTLTEGRPRVTEVVALGRSEAEVVELAASVETGSSHPLALAIIERAKSHAILVRNATEAKAIAGQGVTGTLDGTAIFVGAPRHAMTRAMFDEQATSAAEQLEAAGKTVAAVIADGILIGLIAMRDEPREDAVAGIAELKAMGIRSLMLTGDNARTGAAIAGSLGMEHKAELMPEDKVAAVKALSAKGAVMMIGDGINDAPALAAASIGVAMGSGTDVALETADAAILKSRVRDVPAMIRLARATMGNIRVNIAIALGLKAVFLVTTVFGYTGLWVAILADTGATVIVTANALRLLRFNAGRAA